MGLLGVSLCSLLSWLLLCDGFLFSVVFLLLIIFWDSLSPSLIKFFRS